MLWLDSDMLVSRLDKDHNYLVEMMDVSRPTVALFVALSICLSEVLVYISEGRGRQ